VRSIGECPDVSDEERAEGLNALSRWLVDPNNLDRETLANIEELTDPEWTRGPF